MANQPLLQLDLPGVRKLKSGKVREVFDLGDRLLFVATDRISAFDVIMPNGIPRKGEVLTQISYFWFAQTEAFQPNHLLSRGDDPLPAQPSALCRATRPPDHDRQEGPAAGHRMRRPRLPRRLGLEGIPRAPNRLRHQAPARPGGILGTARAHLHARHQGRDRPRREYSVRARRARSSARTSPSKRGRPA